MLVVLTETYCNKVNMGLINPRQGSGDLEKVCDCVCHSFMLTKLKFYGITGKALTPMKSYLKNKHQRVTLKNQYFNLCSRWRVIEHGVT